MRFYFTVAFVLSAVATPTRADVEVNVTVNVSKTDCACADDGDRHSPPCKGDDRQAPGHCVQYLYADFPGSHDLYICDTYHGEECIDAEPELWYGPQPASLPQDCDQGPCEAYTGQRGHKCDGRALPGHDLALSGRDGWREMEGWLKAAQRKNPELTWGEPHYHKIPRNKLPAELGLQDDLLLVAVTIDAPAKKKEQTGYDKEPNEDRQTCFAVQLDSLGSEDLTAADDVNTLPRTGKQLSVEYSVEGEKRRALLWLK